MRCHSGKTYPRFYRHPSPALHANIDFITTAVLSLRLNLLAGNVLKHWSI
jgi:hypothetical protein